MVFGGNQIKNGAKRTGVSKCQTMSMSVGVDVAKNVKILQVLLSVFNTLHACKLLMGYANQMGYAT